MRIFAFLYQPTAPPRPLIEQHILNTQKILIALLPEIILDQLIRRGLEIQQRQILRRPLRPLDQRRGRAQRVRVEVVEEADVVLEDALRGDGGGEVFVEQEQVAGVECAEDGGAGSR